MTKNPNENPVHWSTSWSFLRAGDEDQKKGALCIDCYPINHFWKNFSTFMCLHVVRKYCLHTLKSNRKSQVLLQALGQSTLVGLPQENLAFWFFCKASNDLSQMLEHEARACLKPNSIKSKSLLRKTISLPREIVYFPTKILTGERPHSPCHASGKSAEYMRPRKTYVKSPYPLPITKNIWYNFELKISL